MAMEHRYTFLLAALAHKSPCVCFTCLCCVPLFLQSLKWLQESQLSCRLPGEAALPLAGAQEIRSGSSPSLKALLPRACRVRENGTVKASLDSAMLRPVSCLQHFKWW